MWKWFTDYFDLRRGERRGAAVLLSLLLVLIIGQYFIKYLVPARSQQDFSEIQALAAEFERNQAAQKDTDESGEERNFFQLEKSVSQRLFAFDPNTLSEDGFIELGLSKKIASNIIKYRSKGGRFRKPEDFSKIYGISEEKFQELLPFIAIKSTPGNTPKYQASESPLKTGNSKLKTVIELNSADSLQLLSIPGIGPAFASRILKYRKKLGGFYQKEQLKEVYGLDSQRYAGISKYVSVNEAGIDKININSASQDQLGRHPYIGYKLAKNIVNYRNKHGRFNGPEDVKKLYSLNASKLPALAPYLSFE